MTTAPTAVVVRGTSGAGPGQRDVLSTPVKKNAGLPGDAEGHALPLPAIVEAAQAD